MRLNIQVTFELGLVAAAGRGMVKRVKYLIENGEDLNQKDSDGSTALHEATANNSMEIVAFLVKSGSDVNTKDNEGFTPLHFASINGSVEILSLLIEAGSDVNSQNEDGATPLHFSAVNEKEEVVTRLLRAGSNVNLQNQNGEIALHTYALKGSVDMVSLLIKAGSDLNLKSKYGHALVAAVCSCNLEVVSLLIKAGSDLNLKNKDGSSALHRCVDCLIEFGSDEVANCLMESGCDVNLVDTDGDTVLHIISQNDPKEKARICPNCEEDHVLKKHIQMESRACSNCSRHLPCTEMFGCLKSGIFVCQECDATAQDQIKQRMSKMATSLLESGSDIFLKNHKGEMPFDVAIPEMRPLFRPKLQALVENALPDEWDLQTKTIGDAIISFYLG